jgi:hypothetical protein
MRVIHAAAILVTSFTWGIWCGGDLTEFLRISLAGFIGAFGLLVISTLISRTALGRISMAIGTIAAISMGFVLGSGYATSAFNDCANRGEVVRKELARYKDQKGRYPNDLSELEMDLPGKRLLRGNILNYRRTEKGYDLQFQDWLITHVANESSEFFAQK